MGQWGLGQNGREQKVGLLNSWQCKLTTGHACKLRAYVGEKSRNGYG